MLQKFLETCNSEEKSDLICCLTNMNMVFSGKKLCPSARTTSEKDHQMKFHSDVCLRDFACVMSQSLVFVCIWGEMVKISIQSKVHSIKIH